MNILVVLLAVFFILWIAHSIAFDRVIKYQFDNFYDAWVQDGKPRGIFFKPQGSSVISFWCASFRALTSRIPDWVEDDEGALSKYRKLKYWDKVIKYYLMFFFPLLIVGKILISKV